MKSKIVSVLIVGLGVFGLVACGANGTGGDGSRPGGSQSSTSQSSNSQSGSSQTSGTSTATTVQGTAAGKTFSPQSGIYGVSDPNVLYGTSDTNFLQVQLSTNPQACAAVASQAHQAGEIILAISTSTYAGDGNYVITPDTSNTVRLQSKASSAEGTQAALVYYDTPAQSHILGVAQSGGFSVTGAGNAKDGNLTINFSFDFGSAGNMSGAFLAVDCNYLTL